MVKGMGSPDRSLLEQEVRTRLEEGTPANLFDRKRVLVLTPDATRTCPLPMMVRSIQEGIGKRSAKLDFMVGVCGSAGLGSGHGSELKSLEKDLKRDRKSGL